MAYVIIFIRLSAVYCLLYVVRCLFCLLVQVCGVLYWSELSQLAVESEDQSILGCIDSHSPEPSSAFLALWSLAFMYAIISVLFSLMLHK